MILVENNVEEISSLKENGMNEPRHISVKSDE